MAITFFCSESEIRIGDDDVMRLEVDYDPYEDERADHAVLSFIKREGFEQRFGCSMDAEALRLLASCIEAALAGGKQRIQIFHFDTQYEEDGNIVEVRFTIQSSSHCKTPTALIAIKKLEIGNCGQDEDEDEDEYEFEDEERDMSFYNFDAEEKAAQALIVAARTMADGLDALLQNQLNENRRVPEGM